jgi:hypothetical protein
MASPNSLLFDCNQALDHSQTVGPATPLQQVVAALASNALPWEPGEFANGVGVFGPGNNVFIVHNAGTSSGVSQRYVYMGLETQVPLILTKLDVNVGSNAQGNSPDNPVTIAVEAASTQAFQDVVELGTISTVNGTLSMDTIIPRGITFIRLRATSPIPDGSNYIAYSPLTLTASAAPDGRTSIGASAATVLTHGVGS